MPNQNSFTSQKQSDRQLLLVFCLLVSLLLHLLAGYLAYKNRRTAELPLESAKPILVQLVDKPVPARKQDYEVDQRPQLPAEKPPAETSRLAEKNQQVAKQQAPKGQDERDQSVRPASPAPPAAPAAPAPKPAPVAEPAPRPATRHTPVKATAQRPPAENGQLPAQPSAIESQQPNELRPPAYPSLQQLTQLPASTLDRSVNAGRAEREKIRQRDDIDEGDTVWLNLERGLLISFFRRFRNQIEGVWNYPADAAQQGLEGVLQVKITVNRDGELLDVELLNSSGADILDFEAIQAIYRAAPFGPLPKQYAHPDLKIYAHFRYQISGRYIYGRR